ncbi:MAG: hypothetical protein IT381_29495 [Deltaproteobacteria bacterium]|nr:hypothetical protein [Deltaproteobacteria bacterium]
MYKTLDDVLTHPSRERSKDVVLPYAPVATERIAVILNKNAKQVDDKVAKRLGRLVPASDFYFSHTLEEAEAFARQVVQRGYGTILCGGGDGTLVNVMNHVFRYVDEANDWRLQRARHFGERQPLLPYPEFGVLKLGTGNGLSSVVGATKPAEDLQKVLSGPRHSAVNIDLIESEGQRFFFAGMGYDARILNDYNAMKEWAQNKKTMKKLTATAAGYLMAILGKSVPTFMRDGFAQNVRVTNQGDDAYFMDPRRGDRAMPLKHGQVLYEGPAALVGCGTTPFYGFGFKIYPFAGVRPGMMNLRIATCNPFKPLLNLPSLWKGHWRSQEVLDFLVTKVKVEMEKPMPYQHSGDGQGSRDNITFQISERPLKVVDYRGAVV